jgi:integration host factor subunit beta
MTKSSLIAKIASSYPSFTSEQIHLAVNKLIEQLSLAIAQGQRIEIRGFGSFCLRHQAAREAHNPKTGEKINTLNKHRTHFKPGKKLRDRVNQLAQPDK